MDNSIQEHATEMRLWSYWILEHVLSRGLHREPQLTIFAFSANDTLHDLSKFLRNGYHGLGTRYGNEISITLKLRTCTFTCTTLGTNINHYGTFGERPFTWSAKFSPKRIIRSTDTLRRWEASYWSSEPVISAVLHWETLLTISTLLAFSVNDRLPDLPKFPRNG